MKDDQKIKYMYKYTLNIVLRVKWWWFAIQLSRPVQNDQVNTSVPILYLDIFKYEIIEWTVYW